MHDHEQTAAALRAAYHTGAIAPLREALDPADADGAYAVQAINTRFWSDAGRRIVGRKVGLTAKAVQAQLGVNQPDFGVLFDDMQIADGGTLDPVRTLQPKAEAEIAIILADCLLLVAPTMLLLAIAGVAMLWHIGRRPLALSAACALLAMLVLPPVMGFALFFCLVHSPIQFRSHATALGLRGIDQWGGTVIPLSLGGLGIAVAIFALGSGQSLPDGIFASSFMALSVLTAPHMAVPMILRMAQNRETLAHI